MTPPRYLKWDYDQQIVIEYHRTGECNGCGQCCRAHIEYKVAGAYSQGPATMGSGTNQQGVWYEVSQEGNRYLMSSPVITLREGHRCPLLSVDNLCTRHEDKSLQKKELMLCAVWPVGPEQVEAFDECSYEFEEVCRWALEDIS